MVRYETADTQVADARIGSRDDEIERMTGSMSWLVDVLSAAKRLQQRVVTEVVLFSVVAFKTLDISQGSVATHLRCGEIFSDSIITHFLLILRVK